MGIGCALQRPVPPTAAGRVVRSGRRVRGAWFCLALSIAPALAMAQPAASAAPGATAADEAERSALCAKMNARFDAAFAGGAARPPIPRLAALQRAARQIGEDPAGCVRERILAIERAAREQLVRLTADGVSLPPNAVYRCRRIEPDLRCRGWQSDDSDHLGEFAAPAAVTAGARLRFTLAPAYHPKRMRAYLAASGGREPQPLAILRKPAGLLSLPGSRGDGRLILIVEEASRGPFIKYVWTLRFADAR